MKSNKGFQSEYKETFPDNKVFIRVQNNLTKKQNLPQLPESLKMLGN